MHIIPNTTRSQGSINNRINSSKFIFYNYLDINADIILKNIIIDL